MLQCAQRVQSSLTACLASATLCHSVLDKCCLMSRCDRRVLSRYSVLSECCLALPHAPRVLSYVWLAWRVLYCVTVCLASAVLCYVLLGECSLLLLCARQVMSHVTVCSASDVSCYSVLGK